MVSCNNSQQPTQILPVTSTIAFTSETNTPSVEPPAITSVPSSTLYPTLDSEGTYELVFHLLQDNSDCKLPCWWGITPGVTASQDAISFLNSFSFVASTDSTHNATSGYISLDIPNGGGLLSTFIDYDSIDGIINTLIVGVSQIIKNQDGGYDQVYDDPAFAQATQFLSMPEILRSYGQPKEVMLATYSLQPLGWPVVFDLQLFYPEQGFLMVYHSLMEFSRDGYIQGCPAKSNISIGLWEPGKYLSINDLPGNIRNNISSFPLSAYLQVNEATDMSIQDFYDAFKNDEGILCLETPTSLWPFPGQ
jgi:hypothetical protein